ncbi:hypothetical protein C4K33_0805 [Pseudomonas chlororaphis subsp. piscium]|nr:hypothetical protein C4K33_0805 [Pseudomonas chlororaphis subsp. piscium]AZC67541.1 hypothetical protein C4K32_0857 [Pseudomonas chlororaphis subsp. piscium]
MLSQMLKPICNFVGGGRTTLWLPGHDVLFKQKLKVYIST